MIADKPHLQIKNLIVEREGRPLFEKLDLSIGRGAFICIEGRSGAGKSSLLSCLAGMLEPASGQITYRCQNASEHSPKGFCKKLGLVFQHLRLTPNATAETNVLCGLLGQRSTWRTLLGFPRADRQRAIALLEKLGIAHLAQKPVAHISGGERQRVAVARALIGEPECVLADEPVSSLDPQLARQVLSLLKQECARSGCTVLCTLHDSALSEEFSDATLRFHSEGGWDYSAGGRS